MAHRSHVPKFSNSESGENMPHTSFFDEARKARSRGKMISDPEENSDILSSDSMPPTQAPPPLSPRVPADSKGWRGHRPVRPMHERKISNDSDLEPFAADSPSMQTNRTEHQVQGAGGTSSRMGDQSNKRVVRGVGASDHSIDKSPIHHQARFSGRGSGSPSSEGRVAQNGSHGTPGRSRFGVASRGDELMLDKGSTIPKFGEWDENNPASANGYTGIFNQVREERQTGARNGPGYIKSPYGPGGVKKGPSSTSKICCFPWCRS